MDAAPPADITRLLSAWGSGDEAALEQLVPAVYTELHRMARHSCGASLPAHAADNGVGQRDLPSSGGCGRCHLAGPGPFFRYIRPQ